MGRFRSLVSSLSLSLSLCSALALLALALALGGCNSGASGRIALAPSAGGGQHAADTTDGGSGLPDGGEPAEDESGGDVDGGGGGGGLSDAQPTVIQSLFDFTQTGIAPWGPVLLTQQVTVNGQLHTINRLASSDPFTAMYQLENGDIVLSNRPVEELVCPNQQVEVLPPTEVWNGPDGPETIFSGQIMALFKPEVTQQQIEQFIAAHNLHVIMSWFEPPDEIGGGNAIASFQFRYDPQEFPAFSDAYTYFQSSPLMLETIPNYTYAFSVDYSPLPSDDTYYLLERNRHINVLGIDSSNNEVNIGPPFGQPLSRTAAAVFDDGVYRPSEDLIVPGANPTSKISWVGITASTSLEKSTCGFWCGQPTEHETSGNRTGALVTHGTQVAGTITACTRNNDGAAGVAPRIGILPVRLYITRLGPETFDIASVMSGIVLMRKCFQYQQWLDAVRVINMSFGYTGTSARDMLNYWISRDATRCNRLFVASAGNDYQNILRYPAALPVVLGVSGLWTTEGGETIDWYDHVLDNQADSGSNYYIDPPGTLPENRAYPVSGIFNFTDTGQYNRYNRAYVPATYLGSLADPFYWPFNGTSFAAPQITGLAALLFDQNSNAQFSEVARHIVITREMSVETDVLPLAGPVDFNAALSQWP